MKKKSNFQSKSMMEVCINAGSSNQFPTTNIINNNNNITIPVKPKRDFRFKVIEVQSGPKWFVWPSRNRGSSEDVDENHNKASKANTQESDEAKYGGYGALRRSVVRSSKRKQDQESIGQRTASEPAATTRRLSAKKEKAVTEPVVSQVSSMFKIISIDKKWESFDAADSDEEETPCHHPTSLAVDASERRWTTSI